MPLVAQVDGVRTVSVLLTTAEWTALQRETRARRVTVRLPCGRSGHLRTSSLGTRFFAHNPNAAGRCTSHPKETPEHLLVKALIVEAAVAAGWAAEPEVRGPDWIADVLAERDGQRVAFEVQWSPQTRDAYEDRQAKYTRDGIRCVWFARHAGAALDPDPALPIHPLAVGDDGPTVDFGNRRVPVPAAAESILAGRVQWRAHVGRPERTLTFHRVACPQGKHLTGVWRLDPAEMTAPCGHKVPETTTPYGPGHPDTAPEAQEAAQAVGRERPGGVAGVTWQTGQRGGRRLTFTCPRCAGDIEWPYAVQAFREPAVHQVTIPNRHDYEERAHWCHDTGNGLCIDTDTPPKSRPLGYKPGPAYLAIPVAAAPPATSRTAAEEAALTAARAKRCTCGHVMNVHSQGQGCWQCTCSRRPAYDG